jgi:hypothetical protein
MGSSRIPILERQDVICACLELAARSAVHVRRAAHKATTQRGERVASLCCTGRQRAFAAKAARPVVLPYRRDMPARKRPTPEDTVTARQTLLDGWPAT